MKPADASRIIPVLLAVLGTSLAVAGPVNINSADAATLSRELKGIGTTKAAAIVDYRQKHGAFKSLDELALVKGVGQKLIDRNRNDLKLGPAGKPAATPPAALPIRK
jgi:competence protein ComEA